MERPEQGSASWVSHRTVILIKLGSRRWGFLLTLVFCYFGFFFPPETAGPVIRLLERCASYVLTALAESLPSIAVSRMEGKHPSQLHGNILKRAQSWDQALSQPLIRDSVRITCSKRRAARPMRDWIVRISEPGRDGFAFGPFRSLPFPPHSRSVCSSRPKGFLFLWMHCLGRWWK